MSRWEDDRGIDAEISPVTGEVMLSASDVVAWLRECAKTMEPRHLCTPGIEAIADRLADNWLKATRNLVDETSDPDETTESEGSR